MRRTRQVVVAVLALELRMYVGLLRLVGRRPDVPPSATPHPYVGAVALLLWVITVVSAVELVALHLIIPWEGVRIAADVVGVWGLVWALGMTGCHYVYPHLTDDTGLRIRSMRRTPTAVVGWDAVSAASVRERSHDSSRAVQVEDGPDGPVLLVVVGSRTNLDVRLAAPVEVRVRGVAHDVVEVRLFADDPRALRAAATAALRSA